jgi:hypothetical protein
VVWRGPKEDIRIVGVREDNEDVDDDDAAIISMMTT